MFWDRVFFLQERIHRHTSCNLTRAQMSITTVFLLVVVLFCWWAFGWFSFLPFVVSPPLWTHIGLCKGPGSLLILPTWRLHLFLLNSILANEHELRPGESQAGEGRKKKLFAIVGLIPSNLTESDVGTLLFLPPSLFSSLFASAGFTSCDLRADFVLLTWSFSLPLCLALDCWGFVLPFWVVCLFWLCLFLVRFLGFGCLAPSFGRGLGLVCSLFSCPSSVLFGLCHVVFVSLFYLSSCSPLPFPSAPGIPLSLSGPER